MEKTIARKIKMYDKTDFVLQKYEPVWAANMRFKENVISFREYKTLTYEKISLQMKSAPTSAGKKMAFDKMIALALLVCNLGITYASSQNNSEFKKSFDFSESDLKKGLEDDIWQRCEDISKAAFPVNDKLIELGMPVDQLDKLNDAIDNYKNMLSLPESIINASKSAKEDMLDFIAKADEILKNRLDKMLLLFKETHPDFYNEYFNARYIGGWHKKKDGEVEGNEEEAVV